MKALSTVNETIDCLFPGISDAPNVSWLNQTKDALLQLPSVFLAFLVPTPPIATFVNQESGPSLGDWNFHLSSRWWHNIQIDLNLRSQALNLNPDEFGRVICFDGNVLSQRITCGFGSNAQAVDQVRIRFARLYYRLGRLGCARLEVAKQHHPRKSKMWFDCTISHKD